MAIVVLLAPAGIEATAAPSVDYLYIDANEGSSAGGHTAIRFGTETFHFQQHPGRVLRVHRDDSQRFLQYYSRLQNRTVRATHVRVSDEAYAQLRDTFARHTLAQDAQFALHAALQRNADLLDALSGEHGAGNAPPHAVLVRGAGLFDAADPRPSPALVALRERVAAELGSDALACARRKVDEAIADLIPTAALPANPPAPEVLPLASPPFSTNYVDLLTTRVALAILANASPLRAGAARAAAHADLVLAAPERAALQAFAARLSAELVALVASRRPDRGFALMLGMARLDVIERSVRSGRLVVLDALPVNATTFSAAQLAAHGAVLAELVEEAGEHLAVQRAQLAAPIDEAAYSDLEAAANRWLELEHATRAGGALRVHAGRLLPEQPGWVADLPRPALAAEEIPAARAHAVAVADAYGNQLAAAYAYNLVTHNCVSEIFATIDRALAGLQPGHDAEAASERVLGGRVSMPWPANFIPFVSAERVARTYRIDGTTVTAPYRRLRIDEMIEHEPAWWVHLREGNTLTSTLYAAGGDDSTFVFFTDGAVWPRPLLGAVNLAAGAVGTATGLLTAPFDGGARLRAGINGVLFSAPELAFLNLRKGTFPHVPRAYRVAFASVPNT